MSVAQSHQNQVTPVVAATRVGNHRKTQMIQDNSKPDWNVAIIDGKPEVVINLAGLAELVRNSPLGMGEAMRRMKALMPADIYPQLAELVEGAAA